MLFRLFFTIIVFVISCFYVYADEEQCSAVFSGGAQNNNSSGTISFNWHAKITNNPNNILASANAIIDNSGGTSCDSTSCTSSGDKAEKIDFNDFVNNNNNVSLGYQQSLTISPGNYNNISVGTQATLNLSAGDYVLSGTLTSLYASNIRIVGGGVVRIFVKNTVQLGSSANINSGGNAKNFFLYAKKDIESLFGTTINGYLYSVKKITLENASVVNGAVNGKNILFISGSTVNFINESLDFGDSCNDSSPLSAIVNYQFDECSYTGSGFEVIDQTGDFNAQIMGVTNSSSDAIINQSLNLLASDKSDWVHVPSGVVDGLDDFTFSVWVNTSVSKSQQEIFHALGDDSDDDELEIYLKNDDKVYIKIRDDSETLNSDITLTDGNWHHIALTRSDKDVCLFVDGVQQDCDDGVEDGVLSTPNSDAIVIGQEQDDFGGSFSTSQSFEGKIDEFKFFASKLSDGDINNIYNNERFGNNYDGSARAAVDYMVPIAEYRFDEVSYNDVPGEIIESISGLNGQAKSSQPTSGKVCNAIDLSPTGTSDYAILSKDILSSTTDFTVSLWAKTSKTGSQSILSGAVSGSNNELIMWFSNATSFRPYLKDRQNGSVSITTIADDSWHHLVWTREGSQSCLYRDKVLQGCRTQSTSALNIASLILGQEQDNVGGGFSSSQAFNGLIDELVVFDSAISTDAIATIYDNQDAGNGYDGSARTCAASSPPVLDMRFDENDWSVANSILDSSGSGFHASATNVSPASGLICNAADMTATGIDDYITLNNQSLDGRSSFTISLWYKTPKLSNQSIISGSNLFSMNELIMWFNSATNFGPHISGNTQSFNIDSISDNTWHHAVWTRSGTNNLFYRDGVLQAGKATLPSGTLDISSLILGQEQDLLAGGFDAGQAVEGLVDELLIFSQALPSSEILAIFNNQSNGLNYDGTVRADCLPLIDHFEIIHDGTGLTCDVEPVTIRVCADASCSILSQDAVDVVLSVNGAVDKTITVSGGSTSSSFSHTSAGTATLSLDQTYECVNGSSTSCNLTFADTGFRFYSNTVNTNIPTQLSGKTSNTGFNASSLYVQAIQTNSNTGACEAALVDNTVIEMLAQCENPSSCTGKKVVIGNGSSNVAISSINSGATSVYTNITLDFGNNTQNAALFNFNYPDAGQIKLTARYNVLDENNNPTGSYISGSSNSFVVRPLGFYIDIPGNTAAESAVQPNSAFKKAGESFTTSVTAMQWQAADDSNNDGIPDTNALLSNNIATVNFGHEINAEIANVAHSLVLPSGGAIGSLTATPFSAFTNGVSTQQLSWSEVGIIDFSFNLSDSSYLGSGDVTGYVPYVGRFYPDHFDVAVTEDGTFSATCEATMVDQNFVYSGQLSTVTSAEGLLKYSLLPTFSITAKAFDNGAGSTTTKNYTGDFMKLIPSSVDHAILNQDTTTLGKNGTNLALSANINDLTFIDDASGVLSAEYNVVDNFVYTHEANAEVIPFVSDIDLSIVSIIDEDNVVAIDGDGVSDDGIVLTLNPLGIQVRYGRLYIDNSFGPETSILPQKLSTQYLFNGTTYITNTDDNCTAFTASNMSLSAGTILPNGHVANPTSGLFIDGVTQAFYLNETGSQGNINVFFNSLSWLKHDWDTTDANTSPDQNPSAVATFGIFRGNDRIIYQREMGN